MVGHQWPADDKYRIRLRVDCCSGETSEHRSLGAHPPLCLPDHFCHEAWDHERPAPIQYACSAAALLYRKRGLPRRSKPGTVQTDLGGPCRCGQPPQNDREHAGRFERHRGTPLSFLPARTPNGVSQTRAIDPIRLVGVASGHEGDRRGGEDVWVRCRKAASSPPPPMHAITMCMFTEPPLRMRNAKYMRVGIPPVKAPDQGVCRRAYGSPTAQSQFSRQKRRGRFSWPASTLGSVIW
ncbi:hypothetical protein INS49_001287 [Diaporthe citri]|uniref:uncharacterized protein n=1 Tax=Diaporthe citri TaxID=83186 RepID=UPI001C7FA16C|nr:uncharacterized protein INS49_001287 [Diaporthe citri]KAG6367105.1 hypothetical protein INS49_001287 [Diaporthe citri]